MLVRSQASDFNREGLHCVTSFLPVCSFRSKLFFCGALPLAAMAVRRVKKKTERRQSFGACNLKLQGRRRAVAEFNALLGQLGADALSLGREVVPDCLERVLRLLDKRCIEEPAKDRFRAAVFQWVDNGGRLPEGGQLNGDLSFQMQGRSHLQYLSTGFSFAASTSNLKPSC